MDQFTRCTSCFTEISATATSCHHCGHRRGPGRRSRWLGKGGLTFILVWVLLFAVADGIYLLNQRKLAFRRDDQGVETAQAWLQGWLEKDGRLLHRHGSEGRAFVRALERTREENDPWFPEDEVLFLGVTPRSPAHSYPDPHRVGRVLHRDCRIFNFQARGERCGEKVEISGSVWVRGRQGPGEVVHVDVEQARTWRWGDEFSAHGSHRFQDGVLSIKVK